MNKEGRVIGQCVSICAGKHEFWVLCAAGAACTVEGQVYYHCLWYGCRCMRAAWAIEGRMYTALCGNRPPVVTVHEH